MKAHAKFQEGSSIEKPKNRGEQHNYANIAKSKKLKNGENSRNFSKFKKTKPFGSRKCYDEGACKISGS